MIIDMHANITPYDPDKFERWGREDIPGDPEDCQVEPTLRRMDANGIDASVVWSVGRTADECRRNNEFVAGQRDKHPDRFIGFATVDPKDLDAALAEIDRAVDELGLVGVKLHPKVMVITLDDPRFVSVVRRVAERGIPLVTHVNTTRTQQLPTATAATVPDPTDVNVPSELSSAGKLRPLIEVYDDPRFQSAHMGGVLLPWLQESRISFQTAGASAAVIEWAVATVGVERIVFGSDFPFFRVEDELAKVRALDISDDEREALLSGNALSRVLPAGSRPEHTPDIAGGRSLEVS